MHNPRDPDLELLEMELRYEEREMEIMDDDGNPNHNEVDRNDEEK